MLDASPGSTVHGPVRVCCLCVLAVLGPLGKPRCSRGTISHCHFLTPVRRKRSPFLLGKDSRKTAYAWVYVCFDQQASDHVQGVRDHQGRAWACGVVLRDALLRFGFQCDKHRLANFPGEHNTFPHVPPGGGICRCFFSLPFFFFTELETSHDASARLLI